MTQGVYCGKCEREIKFTGDLVTTTFRGHGPPEESVRPVTEIGRIFVFKNVRVQPVLNYEIDSCMKTVKRSRGKI